MAQRMVSPITWEILEQTRNRAAVPVLVEGLDGPPATRAIQVLLARRDVGGYRALLARWSRLPQACKEALASCAAPLSRAVRDAILGNDPHLAVEGFDALLWLRDYDLIPAVVRAVIERDGSLRDLAEETLLTLCQQYERTLRGTHDSTTQADRCRAKEHILQSLSHAITRYDRHERHKLVEAFLVLADHDHPLLAELLQNPHHKAFLVALEILKHSARDAIIDVLLRWMDEPRLPLCIPRIVAHRDDMTFVHRLLNHAGPNPSTKLLTNMRRVANVQWLQGELRILELLSDDEQAALVRLAVASGMKRQHVFEILKEVMQRAKEPARRAASEALVDFGGFEANQLVLKGLDDPDPTVQANCVRQLRQRSVPGSITRLVAALDSPHEETRRAARESLSEFTFERFIISFDLLEESVRKHIARLVLRVDPSTIPSLTRELRTGLRTRRLRAIEAAVAMRVVDRVESILIEMLSEDDHFIRAAAVRALAASSSDIAKAAAEAALEDNHPTVRDEAAAALEQLLHRNGGETNVNPRLTELVESADWLRINGPAATVDPA